MKGRRVIWEWRVRLWIHDDATDSQEEMVLDQIPEDVDAGTIELFVQDLVGDWGIKTTVEEM